MGGTASVDMILILRHILKESLFLLLYVLKLKLRNCALLCVCVVVAVDVDCRLSFVAVVF